MLQKLVNVMSCWARHHNANFECIFYSSYYNLNNHLLTCVLTLNTLYLQALFTAPICLPYSQWMTYQSWLTSPHSVCSPPLSLTPPKPVWQSFLSLFPGMAPIRDSVSHSPNQTGDDTWVSFLPPIPLPSVLSSSALLWQFALNVETVWPDLDWWYREREGWMSERVCEREQQETRDTNTISITHRWKHYMWKRLWKSETHCVTSQCSTDWSRH